MRDIMGHMAATAMVRTTTRQLVDAPTSALHEFEQNSPVHASSAVSELERILPPHIDGLEAVETPAASAPRRSLR
jgi:hypothetical protein